MRKSIWIVLAALACVLALAGCAREPGQAVMSDPALMGKVMDMIAADSTTAAGMAERLVGNEQARTAMVQQLVSSAGGAQLVMETVGRDQTLIDGALNQAMQDPAMRAHVITLFKGMQMAGAR
jgi:hypothetical protein